MGCLIGKKINKKKLGAELSRRSKVDASGISGSRMRSRMRAISIRSPESSYIFIFSVHFRGFYFPFVSLETGSAIPLLTACCHVRFFLNHLDSKFICV